MRIGLIVSQMVKQKHLESVEDYIDLCHQFITIKLHGRFEISVNKISRLRRKYKLTAKVNEKHTIYTTAFSTVHE